MAELEDKFQKLFELMLKLEQGQEEIKRGQKEMEQGQDEMKKKIEQSQEEIVILINTKVDATEEKCKLMERQNEEKFERMDKKFDGIDQAFQKLEKEFEMEVKEEIKTMHKIPEDSVDNKTQKNGPESTTHMPVIAKPSIKLSPYDGKISWQVYKTQFSIVAEANGWDLVTKACQLATSLRDEAADILRILPQHQPIDFEALSSALELRFGEKCLKDYSRIQLKSRQEKPNETLQELATDVERLSHLAYADCPTEVRETISLQYFIDGVRDAEIQKSLRMAEINDLKSALVHAMRFEAAQQASRRDRHFIREADMQHHSDASLSDIAKTLNEVRKMIIDTG